MSPASSTNSLPVSPLTEEPLPFKVNSFHHRVNDTWGIWLKQVHASKYPDYNCMLAKIMRSWLIYRTAKDMLEADLHSWWDINVRQNFKPWLRLQDLKPWISISLCLLLKLLFACSASRWVCVYGCCGGASILLYIQRGSCFSYLQE